MLAERIGAAELAELFAQGGSLAARLRGSDLPRLSELLARGPDVPEQPLDAEIEFRKAADGRPALGIRVRGELPLVCQRCLAPMRLPLGVDVVLTAVASDREAGELPDPFDSVVLGAEGELALRAVVEDEVLAALPLAPMHADPAQCATHGVQVGTASEQQVTRPFARLDKLLGGRGGDED